MPQRLVASPYGPPPPPGGRRGVCGSFDMARQNIALVELDRQIAELRNRLRAIEADHLATESQITSLHVIRDRIAAAVRKRAKKPAEKPACEPSA